MKFDLQAQVATFMNQLSAAIVLQLLS